MWLLRVRGAAMSDASRALPAHIAGTTPSSARSIPVSDIEGLDGVVEDAGFLKVPAPPGTGTKVLTSTNGVLSWEDAA